MKLRFALILLCLLLVASVFAGCGNSKNEKPIEPNTKGTFTDMTDIESSVSTPDESGADADNIEGFTPEKTAQGVTEQMSIEDTSLVISAFGSYTGRFVEDGTDESVENISALVVRNAGEKPVQVANVTLTNESIEYNFVISTLPAGCSVLVLETDRKACNDKLSECTVSAEVAQCESLSTEQDRVKVTFDGTSLHLKNLTDRNFRAVYVRYKNYTAGNVYLGGITYNATFNNVEANSESVYESSHFYTGGSQVLMVQIVE
ncbi:MAG: hypothetical protein E7563_02170 [Ruminococcaceae bacterium]|nr:hypothetical protein [Oscillospiraceae bacterium]